MINITRNHPVTKKQISIEIPTNHQETFKQLEAYSGSFGFVLDIRSKLFKYGRLSDKQWESVAKCVKPKPTADPTIVAVQSCNIPITISTSSARYVAKVNQWSINPRTLIVTQIKHKAGNGYLVRAKVDWTGNVSECRCCGRALTDWRSQATGVGPYCVKGTGIIYVRNQSDVARFQQDMEKLCSRMGEVEVFIKKWHISHGQHELDTAIQSSTPTSLQIQEPEVTIPVQYFDWNANTHTLTGSYSKLSMFINQNQLPTTLRLHNNATGNMVSFLRHAAARLDGSAKYMSLDPKHPMHLLLQ